MINVKCQVVFLVRFRLYFSRRQPAVDLHAGCNFVPDLPTVRGSVEYSPLVCKLLFVLLFIIIIIIVTVVVMFYPLTCFVIFRVCFGLLHHPVTSVRRFHLPLSLPLALLRIIFNTCSATSCIVEFSRTSSPKNLWLNRTRF